MRITPDTELAETVRSAIHPLTAADADFDPLMAMIGDAHRVLIGEASHGTHEFYNERARLTKRLILERGFDAVVVEGDWPDAYRVNRYVRGADDDTSAERALGGFTRFPAWMWRNTVVEEFVKWLRQFNAGRVHHGGTVGFYGLDLYSLRGSIEAVLAYLDREDPASARRARERYACFDQYGQDSQAYGLMTGLGASPSCEEEVIRQLVDLQRHRMSLTEPARSGHHDAEATFCAEQNARVVRNAEEYYRAMYLSDVSSWNLRDTHMMQTLESLDAHLTRDGRRPRIVVWAHNSHLGDARATEMGRRRGELNLGQLLREQHGRDAVLIGFTTHRGTVTASSDWGAPAERKKIVPSMADSYESTFHHVGVERFLLTLRGSDTVTLALQTPRLERAIGVIYRPETERASHYFHACLPEQFDAVLHFDHTHALDPLEINAEWTQAEAPETYPSGI